MKYLEMREGDLPPGLDHPSLEPGNRYALAGFAVAMDFTGTECTSILDSTYINEDPDIVNLYRVDIDKLTSLAGAEMTFCGHQNGQCSACRNSLEGYIFTGDEVDAYGMPTRFVALRGMFVATRKLD